MCIKSKIFILYRKIRILYFSKIKQQERQRKGKLWTIKNPVLLHDIGTTFFAATACSQFQKRI